MFRGRRLFKAVIFFVVGDIVALICPKICFYICFCCAIALFGAVALSHFSKYKYMQKYFAFLAFGLIWGTMFNSFVLAPFKVYEGSRTEICGYVTEVNTMNDSFTLSVKDERLLPFRFNAKLYSDEKTAASIKKGDRLAVVVECGSATEKRYLLADRCYIQGQAVSIEECEVEITAFDSFFLSVRSVIDDSLRNALGDGDEYVLASSILVGDQTSISAELKEAFRKTGASHYLSISGLHFSLIVLACYFVVLRTTSSYKAACIVSLIVIFLYMPIPSFTPPVVRSAFISVFLFITRLLKLKSDTVTSMSLSLLIILLFNPAAILSIGLQLSYCATLGIIYSDAISPEIALENRHGSHFKRFLRYIQLSFKVSTLALVFTTPIVLLNFGSFSIFSPLFNLLLSPIFSVVLICAIIIAFLSFLFPTLSLYIIWIFELPLRLFNEIVKFFGEFPFVLTDAQGKLSEILNYLLCAAIFIAVLTYGQKREKDGKIFLFLSWGSVVAAALLGF